MITARYSFGSAAVDKLDLKIEISMPVARWRALHAALADFDNWSTHEEIQELMRLLANVIKEQERAFSQEFMSGAYFTDKVAK